jgi:diketogulonate reductase-like aldo/keto reductase
MLKFQVQRGVAPIPKSSSRSRLQENFDIFSFDLPADDVCSIDALNNNSRIFTYPQYVIQQFNKLHRQVIREHITHLIKENDVAPILKFFKTGLY